MSDIEELLENNYLKKEFVIRNLDLSQVFNFTPDDPGLENRGLRILLDWVNRYSEVGNRKKMEEEGYEFPPISYGISPENDWYIFEQWVNGITIRKKVREMLPSNLILKSPEELNYNEISIELSRLIDILHQFNISVQLNDEIPAKLIYSFLLEQLDDEFEMLIEGSWNLDGCSGYCPGCFQRPWCESGNQSCWTEDKEAGKMHLIDSLKNYVSPSPVSLQILNKYQVEHDEKMKKFMMQQPDNLSDNLGYDDNIKNLGTDDDDEIPF